MDKAVNDNTEISTTYTLDELCVALGISEDVILERMAETLSKREPAP